MHRRSQASDVLILGGGLTGLAAASRLGEHAVVLELGPRPGGVARGERFRGYWFDPLIDLPCLEDLELRAQVLELPDHWLVPCACRSRLVCEDGTALDPYIAGGAGTGPHRSDRDDPGTTPDALLATDEVDLEAARACRDAGDPTSSRRPGERPAPPDLEAQLLATYGQAACDRFFFPYYRKHWKRRLTTVAPVGPGQLRTGQDGVHGRSGAAGWYPRPPPDFPVRGTEVLIRALEARTHDLRLEHRVEEIDLETRTVAAMHRGRRVTFAFREACLATLPLPLLVSLCRQTPLELRDACRRLVRNRVLSVSLCIEGPRPTDPWLWCCYGDESVRFNRLIYPHVLDPDSAPPTGWSLVAEITEPAELRLEAPAITIERVERDLARVGALPAGCRILEARRRVIDPAYVVRGPGQEVVVEQARGFLAAHGVTPLGRFGRWEAGSLERGLADGFAWGGRLSKQSVCPSNVLVEIPGADPIA